MSDPRDEPAKFAACPECLDETMKIVKRALEVERAAALMACANRARASKISIPSLDPNEWTTGFNQGCEAAYCEIETLSRDRSALDEMLAQARREQREKDAQIVDTLAEPVHFRPLTFDEAALEVSAAIRAQED